jgi:hypothetical protein
MTIFRICLLDPSERVTEERWISARTRGAALVLARKTLHASKVSGFELWRENRCIRAEMKKRPPAISEKYAPGDFLSLPRAKSFEQNDDVRVPLVLLKWEPYRMP